MKSINMSQKQSTVGAAVDHCITTADTSLEFQFAPTFSARNFALFSVVEIDFYESVEN